jgi:hypothetical protein
MRFRPIGFGQGKTGTIGSSSPSHVSSTTESDEDDELKDTSKFNTPLASSAEHHAFQESLSKSSAKGELFYSGTKMKNAPAAVESSESSQTDTTQDSDSSSGSSGDEEDTRLEAKGLPKPYQPSLKRKLSGTGGGQDTSSPLHSPRANGGQLKKLKILESNSPAVLPKQSQSNKSNNTPKGAMPPASSLPGSGSAESISPSYLRRSTSILPPPRFTTHPNKSSPAPSLVPGKERQAPITTPILPRGSETPSAGSKVTPVKNTWKVAEPKSRSRVERGMSLEDRIKDADPRLSEEQRKEEFRRLRRIEQGRISHAKRRESTASATPSKVVKGSSTHSKANERSTVIKPPPKPSVQKIQAQETAPNATPDINPLLPLTPKLKPKKKNLGATLEKNDRKATKDQTISLFSPPRKVSVILPPKARVSIPK